VASAKFDKTQHDLGFMIGDSYGNGYRLTSDPGYRDALLAAATTLLTRFNPTVGSIQSWEAANGKWMFPVIIDNMMNLELLMWASRASGEPRYREVALAHADTALANHFRPDGSSYHLVDYDPQTDRVRARMTVQGNADASAWARGQAWGLYGYTMMYRETRKDAYLKQAQKIAGFMLHHPRLPADGVPYWDVDDPAIPNAPRDAPPRQSWLGVAGIGHVINAAARRRVPGGGRAHAAEPVLAGLPGGAGRERRVPAQACDRTQAGRLGDRRAAQLCGLLVYRGVVAIEDGEHGAVT
jgi:hypothetical protein